MECPICKGRMKFEGAWVCVDCGRCFSNECNCNEDCNTDSRTLFVCKCLCHYSDLIQIGEE